MTVPDYTQDAKDIASKLERQDQVAREHRKELMDLLKEMNSNLEGWKREVHDAHFSFASRLAALEESKSLRSTGLMLGGGAIGLLLTWIGKKFGL